MMELRGRNVNNGENFLKPVKRTNVAKTRGQSMTQAPYPRYQISFHVSDKASAPQDTPGSGNEDFLSFAVHPTPPHRDASVLTAK